MVWLFCVILFCLSAVAEEPTPEELKRAEELFFNGQLLFDEQRYDKAILAWQQGYSMSKMPGFLKNIAIAQEAQGNYSAAIETVYEYRAFAPFDEQDFLKQWTTELEEKEKLAEQAALEQKEKLAEQERLAQAEKEKLEKEQRAKLKKDKEAQIIEPDPSQGQPTELVPALPSVKPIFVAWGTTGALTATTGIYLIAKGGDSNNLLLEENCSVDNRDGGPLCLTTNTVSKTDITQAIADYNRQERVTKTLMVSSIAGCVGSVWLTSRYFTQKSILEKSYSINMTPAGFSIQGEF